MRITNDGPNKLDPNRESGRSGGVSDIKSKEAKKQARATRSESIESSDKVQVSSRGKDVAKAKAAAMSAPEADKSEKIERLRNQIKAGTYQVDAEKVADRMVDEHMRSAF